MQYMQGLCRYCGKALKDKVNIRCDGCDKAFQDGIKLGEEEIKDKIREAIRLFINLAKD